MKVSELSNEILLEKNFRIVNKSLTSHIKQIEKDVKEVNLGVVKLMVKKAEKFLELLEDTLSSKTVIGIDVKVDKYVKRLSFFNEKFKYFIEIWADNVFQKDIMEEATEILEDLVKRIDNAISTAEDRIKSIMKDITDETNEYSKKLSRKVPQGIAQDIKTRKTQIFKLG